MDWTFKGLTSAAGVLVSLLISLVAPVGIPLAISVSMPAVAQPLSVVSKPMGFDQGSWQSLLNSGKRLAVVFTSVHCVHCPGLVADLFRHRKERQQAYQIVVVMTDGGPADLARSPYREADAGYFFRGNTQALRYSVNPDWRGVTPYVALISPQGGAAFFAGSPPQSEVSRWGGSAGGWPPG